MFLFGALHGRRRGLTVDAGTLDAELLYVGAMFHDLGLTAPYRTSPHRFEVDGAHAARDFLTARGVDETRAGRVWLGIALHTTPGVPEFLAPEVALVTAGVETDVLGVGVGAGSGTGGGTHPAALPADAVAAVVAAHPRPDFKRRIVAAFAAGVAQRPHTTFGTVNADVLAHHDPAFRRPDFVEVIRDSGWPD